MFSRRGAKSAASQSTDLAAPRGLQTKPLHSVPHGAARCLPFPSHLCSCCLLYLNLHSNPTRNYTHCTLLRLKSFTFTLRTKVALRVFMSLINLDLKIVLIISTGLFLAMKLSPPYNWRVAVPWAHLFALTPQHLHPPLGAATQLIPHETWHCSTVTWIRAVQKWNKFCVLHVGFKTACPGTTFRLSQVRCQRIMPNKPCKTIPTNSVPPSVLGDSRLGANVKDAQRSMVVLCPQLFFQCDQLNHLSQEGNRFRQHEPPCR